MNGSNISAGLRAALALAWRGLRHVATSIVAVVVVFWEWGWKPLAALLGRLARLRPFAALELFIRGLPPYAALAVFALPSLLLFPLKLLAIYLVAQGQKVAAAALFIGAKVVGTALVARIFMLTQATLMRIGWFKRLYDWAMPLKAALTAWVRESYVWRYSRMVKTRVKHALAPLVARVRTMLARFRRSG